MHCTSEYQKCGGSIVLLMNGLRKRHPLNSLSTAFANWYTERTEFPSEVREMALAHVVGDKVEAAYRHGDLFEKRRQLAEAWAEFCAGTKPVGEMLVIIHLSAFPQPDALCPTPDQGQHTDAVLGELGFDTAVIAGLRSRGVV